MTAHATTSCKDFDVLSPSDYRYKTPIHINTYVMKVPENRDQDWVIKVECSGDKKTAGEVIDYALVISIIDPQGGDVAGFIRTTARYPAFVSLKEMVKVSDRIKIRSNRAVNIDKIIGFNL